VSGVEHPTGVGVAPVEAARSEAGARSCTMQRIPSHRAAVLTVAKQPSRYRIALSMERTLAHAKL
jgi:hypothetical protein